MLCIFKKNFNFKDVSKKHKAPCAICLHWGFHLSPFYLTCKIQGVKSLQGVQNFQQGEVLFAQAAYKFLHAAKMHFMQR